MRKIILSILTFSAFSGAVLINAASVQQPISAAELAGDYIFHYIGYQGTSMDLTHYTPNFINITATEGNSLKIGPFIWNVYFDATFDPATQIITMPTDQKQPILSSAGMPMGKFLDIYQHDTQAGDTIPVRLQVDAANHTISWESTASVVEVKQVGASVPAATLMGIYLDYSNCVMTSCNVENGTLSKPYEDLLWIERTDDGNISISNLCNAGTSDPITFVIDNENRTATATDAIFATASDPFYLTQLNSSYEPESRTVTLTASTDEGLLTLVNPGVGAFTKNSSNGFRFANLVIHMPFDPFTTSIDDVATDAADENAPVRYFNLQGQQVANPVAGSVVIRVQGGKAEKIRL